MKEIVVSDGVMGAPVRRVEDIALLTGADRFAGDVLEPNTLHVHFVRSTLAHARIASIDFAEALSAPGVVGVWNASALGLGQIKFPALASLLPDVHRPAMAETMVRFVGEIILAVIADSPAHAVDAGELVVVEYHPLPAVVDPERAAADTSVLLFPELGSNVVFDAPFEVGEPRSADVSVTTRILNQRVAVSPLEGNAILACPEADGKVSAYVSTQMPHLLRDLIAEFVGMPPEDLRLRCPAVGGGFGGKSPIDVEYTIVIALARKLRQPLRWVQTRSENLLTMHGRGHQFDVTLEATDSGVLTALKVDALSDLGAYPGVALSMIMTTRQLCNGQYRIPYTSFRIRCVATNTAPMGPHRGAGRPEATALLERALDVLASRLEIDPAELRRRNQVKPDEFPYTTGTGAVYDSGDYGRALEAALQQVDYDRLRKEQVGRRARGDSRVLGIGISDYVELSAASAGFNQEYGSVEVQPDGRIRARVGTSAHGQGHRTVFSQIVAGVFGVDVDAVDIVQGDTDLVPRGMGTAGSRSLQIGGSALKIAADAVMEKARTLASYMLEASTADVDVVPGVGLGVRGVPASAITWADLAIAANEPSRLPLGMTPRLFEAPGYEQVQTGTAPFGTHVAVVEVDVETGQVDLQRFVAIDDCGTVINPMLVEGQVHGGLLAGIGQALFEEVRYDDEGNPQNATFADYLFPSAADLPSFDTAHTVTPTTNNPLGAKGVGEAGTTGSIAAVHNAVVDALSHLGVRQVQLPLSPLQVWSAVQEARAQPSVVTPAAPGPPRPRG
jgi:carbon-monoxide dehydrogenase large subunit